MSTRLRELRDEMAQVTRANESMIDRWIAALNVEIAELEAQPAMTARWGCLAREGDEAHGSHDTRWIRTADELQELHAMFPGSDLVRVDGKLELWTWVDARGRRARRVRP